jgi:hypothetical protein
VATDEHTVAFLDARPVFKGHALVIPRLHYLTLADLPPELTGPLFARVQQVSAAMAAGSGTDGSFIGVNNTVTPEHPPPARPCHTSARTETAAADRSDAGLRLRTPVSRHLLTRPATPLSVRRTPAGR